MTDASVRSEEWQYRVSGNTGSYPSTLFILLLPRISTSRRAPPQSPPPLGPRRATPRTTDSCRSQPH
ncbi:unnamed protein product, partial [Brenthis ino]